MGWIAKWLSEAHQQGVAQLVIDDTLHNLKKRSKLLDGYIPFQTYTSRNFLAYAMERIETVASVISYGTEPPVTQHGKFRRIQAELLKTGLSFFYDEDRQWEMREAMEQAALKRIMVQTTRDMNTGEVIPGANDDLAKFLFGTVEQMAKAQVELLDALTWEILQTGKIERIDPRSKLPTVIDYRNANDITYNHFPAALTGGDRWDQYETARGLRDLEDMITDYNDTNGFIPEKIVMSRKLRIDLMEQKSTKESVNSRTAITVGTVSMDLLSDVLRARGIPEIVTFDEMYKDELSNQSTTNVRFLRDNMVVFLTPDMGKRAMGPTLENDGQTGVYVVTRELQPVPPIDATQGVATVLPVFPDPKMLYARQVKD